jgi:ubiquinone/menaquinone biosynthesis C-methylase UbiE
MDGRQHGRHQDGRQRDERQLPEAAFARSFGSEAGRYEKVRPSYPAAAIELVLARLQTARPDGATARILDLGAGTGKLTASLGGRGAQVLAVEPDRQMLAVLTARVPQAHALAGSAERIPLRDASVDAITVGQAFHWFQRPDADRELARVLRPGGVVGLLWNLPDRSVEWVPKLYQASRKAEQPQAEQFDPLDAELFTELEQVSVPSEHLLPGPEGLRDLVHTWSWVITRSQAEREAIDRRIRILVSQYAELQAPVVVFPQRTEVLWQHRR